MTKQEIKQLRKLYPNVRKKIGQRFRECIKSNYTLDKTMSVCPVCGKETFRLYLKRPEMTPLWLTTGKCTNRECGCNIKPKDLMRIIVFCLKETFSEVEACLDDRLKQSFYDWVNIDQFIRAELPPDSDLFIRR